MSPATAPRPLAEAGRRLGADERREQLVQAGLELMKDTPFDQVSAIDVARAAGVSKGLVFHYFPTTSSLWEAILRAATTELLELVAQSPELPYEEQLSAGLDAFITYIERQPASYVAMTRGAGSDPALQAVFEDTRNAIVVLILDLLGLADSPPAGLRIMLRGWIALVEECTLHWLPDRAVPRDRLIAFLVRAAVTMLPEALTLADPE